MPAQSPGGAQNIQIIQQNYNFFYPSSEAAFEAAGLAAQQLNMAKN